jgi:hypothetical protein
MIGHPSGDEPLMVDVRQTGAGSAEACIAEVMLVRHRRFDRAYNWHPVTRIAFGLSA